MTFSSVFCSRNENLFLSVFRPNRIWIVEKHAKDLCFRLRFNVVNKCIKLQCIMCTFAKSEMTSWFIVFVSGTELWCGQSQAKIIIFNLHSTREGLHTLSHWDEGAKRGADVVHMVTSSSTVWSYVYPGLLFHYCVESFLHT